MAKGRDRTYGIALTAALLLTLSVWMAPAAEAVQFYTAPWTPLAGSDSSDSNGGLFHTAPWTPLSAANGNDGLVDTSSAWPAAAPDSNDGSVHTAPWTPLSVLDGNDGLGQTQGTSEGLLGDDITGPIIGTSTVSAAVPEPATMILLGIGILALMAIGWRRADSLRR